MKLRNLAGIAAGGLAAWWAYRRLIPGFDLRGKTVFITGGTRGLGLVLARVFCREGATVVVCARDSDEVQRGLADLAGRTGVVTGLTCDVRDPFDVDRAVSIVRETHGPIDVLINNAGVITVGPLATQTTEDFVDALNTHFWGPFNTTMAVLPAMRQRGAGRIVNISSIGGKISVPHLVPYCVSKFALTALSEGLRAELAGTGVKVTTVIPGLMRTGSPRNALFKGRHRAEYAWFAISDSLPGLSISAESAARRIVNACRHGDPEIMLGWPCQLGARLHGMFPGLSAEILGLVNRLLPQAGGIGTQKAFGWQSESNFAPSMLTTLTEQAARDNNELLSTTQRQSAIGPTLTDR